MAAYISALLITFLYIVSVVLSQSVSGNGTALPVGSCTSTIPCSNGACCNGQSGFCGFGAAFCKPVSQGGPCTSNCGALAECGPNAAPQNVTCPLNVCCSQFGFCGTTAEFCESPGCQSNCNPPGQQSCGSDQQSALQRRIGYYEGWAMQSDSRACLMYPPEQISAETLTHVNFAFALISSSFSIIEMSPGDALLWVRTTALKQKNPTLRVYLSIGGWSFNDPPTSTIFSQLVGTSANTQTFISSALTILQAFGFDGIDVDWEYPAAYDRGGAPADKANYVTFMAAVKAAFAPRGYGLTFTAPSSFWYLQHFDLPGLLKSADWVNVMTYDLHGTWDGTDPYIGPIVLAHTNLTEIQATMQLFRNVNINPSQIVLGIGFYGRSFQLADPSCSAPGCGFVSGAAPGVCSLNSGTLMFSEIEIIVALAGVQPVFDEAAAVKYIVWNEDQWVSYDDAQTLQMKLNYANSICLGGTMIWSVDQDDTAYTALAGLYPDIDVNTPSSVEHGNQCSITGCGQGCPNGWDALTTLTTNPGSSITCDPRTPATLCCPAGNEPQNCSWRGGGGSTCNPQCAIGEITIATDPVGDDGKPTCAQGTKAFCCQSGQVDPLDCFATGCGESDACASGYTTLTHVKQGSSDNGGCESEEASPDVIQKQPCPTICPSNNKPVCCEENVGYTNCAWVGDLPNCLNSACAVGQVGIFSDIQGDASQPCVGKGQRLFCCTPPNGAAFLPVPENWVFPQNSPVGEGYQVDQPATFTVDFDDDIGTSDPSQTGDGSDGESDDGKENDSAFGEVFISSPNAGSVSSMDFHSDWVVTNCSSSTDQPQKAVAYCSKPIDSDDSGCGHVFIGQAQHTIVRMPSTCGMGPYARVKSLEIHPAQKQALSTYHQALLLETENVYSFEFDYEYLAIPEENGPVLMRADITDIPGYWDAIVNSAPDAGTTTTKRKRDYHNPGHLEERWFGPFDSWLQRLTTVTSSNSISRNFHWSDKYTIFHQEESCPHFSSSLDVSVSGAAQANSRFGYYLEASVVPPAVQQAYVYLSAGASAQATFTISGLAQANFDSERAELISFGFPGLYYPGLLTLGPSLHLYGQLTGSLSMSGNYSTTVSYQFPSLDLSFGKMDSNPDEENTGLAVNPNYSYNGYDFSFGYNVELQGSVEAHLVPSLQLGLSVLGGSLLDAQVFVEADIYGGVGVNGSVSESVAPTFCVQPFFGVDLNAGLTGSVLFWRDNAVSTSFYTNRFPFGGTCFSSAAQPDGSGNSKRDLLISHSGEIGERFEILHNSIDSAYAAYESEDQTTSRNGRNSDSGHALASSSFPESRALVKRGGVPFLPGNLFCPDTGSSITPTGTGTDCDLFDDIADFDPDSPTKRSFILTPDDLPLPTKTNPLAKRAADRTSNLRSCPTIAIEIPAYDTTPIVGYCDLQTPNTLSSAFTTYNPTIPLNLGTTTNGGISLVLPTGSGSKTTPIYAREHPYEVNMAAGFVDYLQQATNLWQNTAGNQNWCDWVGDNLADQPPYINGASVFDTITDTCYPNNNLGSNMIVMEQTANDIKKYALLSQQLTFLNRNVQIFRSDTTFSAACSTKQISILRAAAGVASFLNIPAVRDIFLAQNTCIRNAWIIWAHAYSAAADATQQNPGGVDAPNRGTVNVGNLYDNWINSVVANVPVYLNQQINHLITLYNPGQAANVATNVILSWPALVDNTQRLNKQGGPVNVDPTKVANNVPVARNDLAALQAPQIGWLNRLPTH